MPYPLATADPMTIDGPAWIVCHGREERINVVGLVACPSGRTVDVATCLACRYLARVDSDRRWAWCDADPNRTRGAGDALTPDVARAAQATPPILHVELL